MKSMMRVYLDTSVLGGCFEVGHDTPAISFFGKFREHRFSLIVSDTLIKEIE